MQILTVNITRVVWPHVTNLLDLRYFCRHNPLFYHLNLIPCHYWSWQRNIYFLVNIFVRHTFPMSKSSIKTKTVLTMTDMTKSTELQAFIRQKNGYKVTLKISLCICVVLSWDELKVWQNLLDSGCEIFMACSLVATVNWHKSLQFVFSQNFSNWKNARQRRDTPIKFYNTFWPLLSDTLIDSFNETFMKKEMSPSQRQAVITLIEK